MGLERVDVDERVGTVQCDPNGDPAVAPVGRNAARLHEVALPPLWVVLEESPVPRRDPKARKRFGEAPLELGCERGDPDADDIEAVATGMVGIVRRDATG